MDGVDHERVALERTAHAARAHEPKQSVVRFREARAVDVSFWTASLPGGAGELFLRASMRDHPRFWESCERATSQLLSDTDANRAGLTLTVEKGAHAGDNGFDGVFISLGPAVGKHGERDGFERCSDDV